MCKINEIYYMNLAEFLENWHPDTIVIIKAERKEVKKKKCRMMLKAQTIGMNQRRYFISI